MANVLHHHIEFAPRPVAHAPSPFGFGFGLGQSSSSGVVPSGWQPTPTPGHTNPHAFHQLASSMTHTTALASPSFKSNKRRLEVDDEDSTTSGKASANRDESMDRSPTPERPKRAAPKRARIAPADAGTKEQVSAKENKPPSSEEDEVDVGVLLGMSKGPYCHDFFANISLMIHSESTNPSTVTTVNFVAQSAPVTQVYPFAAYTPANVRHCDSSASAGCEETARRLPLLQYAIAVWVWKSITEHINTILPP